MRRSILAAPDPDHVVRLNRPERRDMAKPDILEVSSTIRGTCRIHHEDLGVPLVDAPNLVRMAERETIAQRSDMLLRIEEAPLATSYPAQCAQHAVEHLAEIYHPDSFTIRFTPVPKGNAPWTGRSSTPRCFRLPSSATPRQRKRRPRKVALVPRQWLSAIRNRHATPSTSGRRRGKTGPRWTAP